MNLPADIIDAEAAALPAAIRLSQRWDETRPADTQPMAGTLIDWRAPTFLQRLRNAWVSALREMVR